MESSRSGVGKALRNGSLTEPLGSRLAGHRITRGLPKEQLPGSRRLREPRLPSAAGPQEGEGTHLALRRPQGDHTRTC